MYIHKQLHQQITTTTNKNTNTNTNIISLQIEKLGGGETKILFFLLNFFNFYRQLHNIISYEMRREYM